MKDKYIFGTIVIIFSIVIGIYISIADFTPKEDKLLKKINELELKIDSLNTKKDSIRNIIDSTHVKIITNEKYYKEKINTIMLQSYSADSCFITDYIRQYANKNPQYNFN